ncbi:MAG: CDP-glucose 4,6-dehydratase [Spirochaetaceae bacterium]|mgnify:CR=1 FL=1|nr:CDP-glucose 4,6-dehydratase [Spirochaetaceae bacterium]|tara:strand:+ start:49681 stop:50772 length:1092 start_codon:yes stop_codon:yes gene_type:complete
MFSDYYQGKRILVTGHTGFKGSWLTAWLRDLGAEVAGFSDAIPTDPNHFELLNTGKEIRDYRGDVRDYETFRDTIKEFKPEIVFHLAAQSLVKKSYQDPRNTFEVNVMGMVNLLTLVRECDFIKSLVLITSDKAYQNVEWCFGYRETDTLAGEDPYSASKSCADIVATSYYRSFLEGTDVTLGIARAGNVIGGGDWAADRIIPDCVRAWSAGDTVEIRSPMSTRPWQHVLEPLSGYLALGQHLSVSPGAVNGEAFNFGPDANVNQTVLQLLEEVSRLWPEASWKIAQGAANAGKEANLLKLSCDKALFYLNWKPVLAFQETIEYTVDWYRNWLRDPGQVSALTANQIALYAERAKERNLAWIQ